MAFPPSKFKTYTAGETLTASDLNSSLSDAVNQNIPEDMDDFSVNTAEMQTTTDPYPASTESLATSLSEEIARLRYLIKQITGEANWYVDPDSDITTIVSGTQTFAGAKTFDENLKTGKALVTQSGGPGTLTSNMTVTGVGAVTYATAAPISIQGLVGGVEGQYLSIVNENTSEANVITLVHNGSGTQKILTPVSTNFVITIRSGVILRYHNSNWHVVAAGDTPTLLRLGASGLAGRLDIFPSTASKGRFRISPADNTNDDILTITNAAQGGAYVYTIPNAGGSTSFAMLAGAQTFTGRKTMGGLSLGAETALTDNLDVTNIGFVSEASGTTFNGFANGVAGQVVVFVNASGASSTTFVFNSGTGTQKFFLPGSANLVIGPRGGATFVCDGSTWFCVGNTNT